MENEVLSKLKEELDELATPVGFEFSGAATATDEISPPEHTLTWVSTFAILALIMLSNDDKENLTRYEELAREWMWRRLTASERMGRFLDGYLVFALPGQPDEAMRRTIRAIELDTAVCRKHVIWPSCESDWRDALWTVTVLGLPPVHASVPAVITSPTLPDIANRALKLYRQLENYETTAERLRLEAHTATDQETSDAS